MLNKNCAVTLLLFICVLAACQAEIWDWNIDTDACSASQQGALVNTLGEDWVEAEGNDAMSLVALFGASSWSDPRILIKLNSGLSHKLVYGRVRITGLTSNNMMTLSFSRTNEPRIYQAIEKQVLLDNGFQRYENLSFLLRPGYGYTVDPNQKKLDTSNTLNVVNSQVGYLALRNVTCSSTACKACPKLTGTTEDVFIQFHEFTAVGELFNTTTYTCSASGCVEIGVQAATKYVTASILQWGSSSWLGYPQMRIACVD